MSSIERKVTSGLVVALVRVAFALMDAAQAIARWARQRDPLVPDLVDELAREVVRSDRRNNARGGRG